MNVNKNEHMGNTTPIKWLNRHKNHDKFISYEKTERYQVAIQICCKNCNEVYFLDSFGINEK